MIDMLFFPEVEIGKLCELRSSAEIYNGQYKILGFTHNIMISDTVPGPSKTTLSLYAGAAGLRAV